MIKFEDKFMDIQSNMISLCLEYVEGKVDEIFIYCIADNFYEFNVFFKVGDKYFKKHEINKVLPQEKQIDLSSEVQRALLKYGIEDIKSIAVLCQEYGREMPSEMKLIYNVRDNSLDANYSYEHRYSRDENLLPRIEFDKWITEVKENDI